jgi:hypothetical protein
VKTLKPMPVRPDHPALAMQAVIMSSSAESEALKKDSALNRPATDRAQGGDAPAFMTEEALLRLEEGLRVQREQHEGRIFSDPDTESSRPGAGALGKAEKRTADFMSTQIEAASENPSSAPGADQSDVSIDEFTQALNRVEDCVTELIRSCSERRLVGNIAEGADSRMSHCHQRHSILLPSKERCHVRSLRPTVALPPGAASPPAFCSGS